MVTAPPTLAGFLAFIRGNMGISATVLPDAAPVIATAFAVAVEIVNLDLAASSIVYALAVYNLSGSNLINYAPDIATAPNVQGSDPPAPYFANLRNKWNITGFVSGVIQSAGDEGTNESMVVQEAAKNFTLADLQYLKDPYGRQYLAIAQRCGTLWGLS